MKRAAFLIVFTVLLAFRLAYGQEHSFLARYFDNSDYNLPSILVKTVFQDSSGFVWIGTDGGLIRYDGYSFFTYRNELPNQYVKDIIQLHDGRLLITTDMGLATISHKGYDFRVKTLLPGSFIETDSTLYYPKKAFQDSSGTIWIAETTSIVRYKNGKMKRYNLGNNYFSLSSIRDFRFAETRGGVLLAVSENGHMVYYNKANDKFDEVSVPFKGSVSFNDLVRQPDGSMWLATSRGVYSFEPTQGELLHGWQRIIPVSDVSSLTKLQKGIAYFGTWFDGLYQVKMENGHAEYQKLGEYKFNNVNDIYQTKSGNIWVGSDLGAVLLSPDYFSSTLLSNRYRYINALTSASKDTLYASESYNVYRIVWDSKSKRPRTRKLSLDLKDARVSALAYHSGKIYVGTQRGDIFELSNDKLKKSIHHYNPGHIEIDQLCIDSTGNIWYIEGGVTGAGRISGENGTVARYSAAQGLDTTITVLHTAPDKTIYAGGIGASHYLFRFDPVKNKFENISPKIPAAVLSKRKLPLTVYDFVIRNHWLYMASNFGLFRFTIDDSGNIRFDDWMVNDYFKSIAIDHLGNLWLGGEKGLFYMSGDRVIQYNGRDGLPSITMTFRALTIDRDGRLWTGTSNGIGYSIEPISTMTSSRTPMVKELTVNDKVANDHTFNSLVLNRGSTIKLTVSGLMYPAQKLNYIARLENTDGQLIRKVESRSNVLTLRVPDKGDYIIKIESDITGYTWSKPFVIHLQSILPWYLQSWAMGSYIIVLFLLGYIIVDYQKVRQDRNNQREQLERWNRIIRRTIDVVPHYLYVRDEDGHFILANKSMAELYNTSPEEIVGKKEDDFVGKNHEETLIRNLTSETDLSEGNTGKVIEYKGADGKQMFLQLTQTYFQLGEQKKMAVAGVAIDITDLVRAEKELRKSQQRYQFLSESAFEGLTVMEDGLLTDANSALLEMTGYTREDVLHKPAWAFFPSHIRTKFEERIRKGVEGQYEAQLTCKDQSIIDIEVLAKDVIIDGRHLRIAAIRDITDRKEAERKLKEYAGKLEESNKNLEEFAYVASHDLQEPLRKIQAFGELLNTNLDGNIDSESRMFLERMINAANRMQKLINDLLSFSRISTRTNPREFIKLDELVKEVCGDLEIAIQQSGATISLEPLPSVYTDPMQMRQLFQNLIGNALKFQSGERPLIISVKSVDGDDIKKGFCRIAVSDNGIGFDPKFAERIFQVFERLHTKQDYQGTGIGLAICKKIVERHGGSIKAESAENVGTTFFVDLPSQQILENKGT